MIRIGIGLIASLGFLPCAAAADFRVLVSTDLGGDPDDIQSLYRLAHYSDILRVEAIVSSPGPGSTNSADKIRNWIKRIDIENMRANGHPGLMAERDLLDRVRQGASQPGAPAKGRTTEGSRAIVERALAPDSAGLNRPLWVLAWGAMTDVAQALFDDPAIASRIRIYSIGSANNTADKASREYVFAGLNSRWPELWWIENGSQPGHHETFRGVFAGGEQSGEWNNFEFVKRHIRGRGGDHGGEFDQISGDAFPLANWTGEYRGILKEGDSPSMLYLLSSAIGKTGNCDDPTGDSWGGRFRRTQFSHYYTDLDVSSEENWSTINQYRVSFLRDWGQRWAWYARR